MKMKIGTKLYAGFGAVVLVTLVLIVYTLIQLNVLRSEQDGQFKRAQDAVTATEFNFMGEKAYRIIADAVINRDEQDTKAAWAEWAKEFESDSAAFDKVVDTKEEKDLMEKVDKGFAELIEIVEKELFVYLFGLGRGEGVNQIIKGLDDKIDGHVDDIKGPMEAIMKSMQGESVAADQEFDKRAGMVVLVSIILAIIGLIVSVILALQITKGIQVPLLKGVDFANKVAAGDLTATVDVKSGDELEDLANALNVTVKKLKELVSNIIDSSDQVAASSEELAKTSQNLSMGAQKQASALEEATASSEEMSSSVRQVSEKAQSQAASVEEVSSSIVQMSSSIKKVAELAGNVKGNDSDKNQQSAIAAMRRIEDSSRKINNIIGVISDIADQTNLLALNASIEAARAGEAGRGFAVVAKEISKLADKSATATKEIANLINETATNVTSGVEMVKMVANSTEEQQTASKQIEEAIQLVNQLSQTIASASEEQSSTSEEMSRTLQGVNQVTQQTAASAEEMASSTEELSGQAESMKKLVANFKV